MINKYFTVHITTYDCYHGSPVVKVSVRTLPQCDTRLMGGQREFMGWGYSCICMYVCVNIFSIKQSGCGATPKAGSDKKK